MGVRYMGQLQALIADDSEFMLTAYKRALESQSNLQIVAILDVRMPILDGIQAAHKIRIQRPETAIVVIFGKRRPGSGRRPAANRSRAQVLSAQAVNLLRFGTGPYHRSSV